MCRFYSFFSVIFSVLLLVGCALQQPDANRSISPPYLEKNDPTWQQHLKNLTAIQAYYAEGQLGYIDEKERFSTRFSWQYRNPTDYSLTLFSALSRQRLTFRQTPHGMVVFDNDGHQRYHRNAQTLIEELTGISVPMTHFAMWLKGIPEGVNHYRIGVHHLLADFIYSAGEQSWSVRYADYHDDTPLPLPRLLHLHSGRQILKLQIDKWGMR